MKNCFKKIWNPKTKNIEIFNYRVDLIIFLITIFGLMIAVAGYIIAYKGLKITFNSFTAQLEEINAKAKIDIKLRIATSTKVRIGPEIIDPPLDISVSAYNSGDYNTSTWAINIIFCEKINVLEFPSLWKKIDRYIYVYQSKEKIINEKMFFSDKIDSIGIFRISMPGKNYSKDQLIPIAISSTYGEKSEPILKVVFFDIQEAKFVYEDLLVNKGKVLTEMRGCFKNTP